MRSTHISVRLSAMRPALFLLLSTPLAPCAAPAQSSTPAADLRTADSLALERTPCLGRCPVYRVVVARSGRVRLEPGINRGYPDYATVAAPVHFDSLAPADVQELLRMAESIRFDSLPPSILDSRALCDTAYTDAPTAIVTIWLPTTVVRVSNYHGCKRSPQSLRHFEERIDEVTGAAERMRPRPSSPPSPHN